MYRYRTETPPTRQEAERDLHEDRVSSPPRLQPIPRYIDNPWNNYRPDEEPF